MHIFGSISITTIIAILLVKIYITTKRATVVNICQANASEERNENTNVETFQFTPLTLGKSFKKGGVRNTHRKPQ
uniref:Putative secreted protein n=1 Tax=Anopheles darlingi TaxID=43151 RepID=A0A2M4DLC3_ANODA